MNWDKVRETLRQERIRQGMSQRDVQELMGLVLVDSGNMSRWETGARNPSMKNFLRWVRVLGLTVEFSFRAKPAGSGAPGSEPPDSDADAEAAH